MNTNATRAPHQNACPSNPRHRNGRIIRPSSYRLRRQPTLVNPQVMNQVFTRPRPVPRENFPLILCRPRPYTIDAEAFNNMWPEFGGATPGFVRDYLPSRGKQMLHRDNTRNTRVLGYSSPGEPHECDVLFTEPEYNGCDLPSHILEVKQGKNVNFFGVHEIVFAVNCATLPYFPCPSADVDGVGHFTLPVVKMVLPSLASFYELHEYLYTKNVDRLRIVLTIPQVYARDIVCLQRQIRFIRDLWANAYALCVVDSNIYIVLQELYAVTQSAIIRHEMGSYIPNGIAALQHCCPSLNKQFDLYTMTFS